MHVRTSELKSWNSDVDIKKIYGNTQKRLNFIHK